MTKFLQIADYPTLEAAQAEYPQMTVFEEVEGGWMAFEFASDLETWKAQV